MLSEVVYVVQYNLSIVELLVAGKISTNHRFSTIRLVINYIKKQMKQKIRPLFTGFPLFILPLFTGYTVVRYNFLLYVVLLHL